MLRTHNRITAQRAMLLTHNHLTAQRAMLLGAYPRTGTGSEPLRIVKGRMLIARCLSPFLDRL